MVDVNKEATTAGKKQKHKTVTLRGEIAFNSVRFAYPVRPDHDVLKGLSLEIPAGKTVALVGSSGSGERAGGEAVRKWHFGHAALIFQLV